MKRLICILLISITVSSYAAKTRAFGDLIFEEDFVAVGVSETDIEKASKIVLAADEELKKINIEITQKELEINRLILDDPEKNWNAIAKLLDEIGALGAEKSKNKLKTQIAVKKYIPESKYREAKVYAIKRASRRPNKKNDK